MKNNKIYLQLFLMFVVATAVILIFTSGSSYLGKTFNESQDFKRDSERLVSELSQNLFNVPTEQDFEGALTVSEEEIHSYRTHYGSLAEQIQNIKEQYKGDIEVAQDSDVIEAIEQERDAKIEDIKKNFEDDDYVKAKIIAIKKKAIQEELKQINSERKNTLSRFNYFAYEFTDEKTGEVYRNGDVEEQAVFENTFNNVGKDFNGNYTIHFSDHDNLGIIRDSYTLDRDLKSISGVVTVPKSWFDNSYLGTDKKAFNVTKYVYYGIVLAGIISFVLLMTYLEPTRELFNRKFPLREQFERLPIDIRIVATIIVANFAIISSEMFRRSIRTQINNYIVGHYSQIFDLFVTGIISFALITAVIFMIVSILESLKGQRDLEKIWPQTFISQLVDAAKSMFDNRSVGMQSLILLFVVFLGGFGLAVVMATADAGVFLFYMFLFVVFFMPTLYIFMRRMGYLNRIMKHTEDMANGRLTKDLKVKGKSPLAKHAQNLNGLREGVRTSLNEQAKSEQMKTELITNVSHDLRTPLTSIITYTDLLKNPSISEEERTKYIGILDAKSNRLKTLIEDLFEVSKMASGNIEISKQRIDLAQLLQQAAGEHGEDFAAANLDLRVNISEQPIYAYVDGQKWWRVIDNLIVNARKYSLEGTRVYVNLKLVDGNAELAVKNVAKYELYEEASQLIERFKRADTSRHTEGSGLGLAIAQSIVDLHGGQLEIAVDGDLFKVTVSVRTEK
ncbi:HAMP domain-containing histidine kinase [Solibacillus sp. A46]|uniref:histidine kinase n=1 Tax=Solibacillus faecavium TaxID=2762221 RepID=A0ABR8Y1W1_9BACL|nr:HAMP domain-containing sensor histidine kinase [Solibacillus faecavium]MBD8038179.1 HAMP domain-containing histidine kinase [Solibacillus faecavium]